MDQLNRELEAAGYRVCDGSMPTAINAAKEKYIGVRWIPAHQFPQCVAYVDQKYVDGFVFTGRLNPPDKAFPYDEGVTYSVRFFGIGVDPVDLDDLL